MPNDVTANVKILPSPFKSSPYSQNVWDLQVFKSKVYIGQGNSANSGPPIRNAGPIPINSLDPVTGIITKEFTVDEEQIDQFRIINGRLTVLGHDSREGWDLGNYYTLETSGWNKHRVLPNGIHVYDMISFKGKKFAAIGTDGKKPNIVVSEDDGDTWKPAIDVAPLGQDPRMYTLFEFENELYSCHALMNHPRIEPTVDINSMLRKWDGNKFLPVPNTLGAAVMFPNTIPFPLRLCRVTNAMGKLLYISGWNYNDHQWAGQDLYVLSTMKPQALNITNPIPIMKAKMPTVDDLLFHPCDILDRGNKVYLLGYQLNADKTAYTNIVRVSTDCVNWTELFRFNNDALARSFEELNGTFYFGMGSDVRYRNVGTVPPLTREYVIAPSSGCIVIVKP